MNLPEYLSRGILAAHGIPFPPYEVAVSAAGARDAAARLGGERFVVKAQVAAGGRGRSGGVLFADSAAQVEAAAARLLADGLPAAPGRPALEVHRVLVQPFIPTGRQLYLGATLRGGAGGPVALFSLKGGVAIEDLAAADPAAIRRVEVDPFIGLSDETARELLGATGLPGPQELEMLRIAGALTRALIAEDATLAELNPLGITPDGAVVALDAKLALDENAFFRHPERQTRLADAAADPLERLAADAGVSYVRLDGTVGCLINGAGLAMEILDLIQDAGGSAANFLDVGGAADAERLAAAFGILAADTRVRAGLVSIFGGILRCDLVAESLVRAYGASLPAWPLVVRLRGNRAAEARAIIAASNLPLVYEDDLFRAVERAVELAGKKGNTVA